ncbi:carboxylate-amine ligase, partial [Streptomyces sp. NPDC054837]
MNVHIGVEEEFHLLEVESGLLVPRAGQVLRRLPKRDFTAELHRSTVESNSGVHASLDSLYADLSHTRRRLDAAASSLGLAVVAAGTAPLAPAACGPPTADARYRRMVEEYRRVADEQLICGAQVHVDVPDRDTAVRVMCPISPWLPVLLALSASSPFWQGADTGYASWRTLGWQRWPRAGPVGCYAGAAEYEAAVDELVQAGIISDPGMIYYDVRPSAHLPTLELRICDACPRAETVVLIAGLFRALVTDARDRLAAGLVACDGHHEWWGAPPRPPPPAPALRGLVVSPPRPPAAAAPLEPHPLTQQ